MIRPHTGPNDRNFYNCNKRASFGMHRWIEGLEARVMLFSVPIHVDLTTDALPFLNTETVAAISAEHVVVDTIGALDSDNHMDNCHFIGGVANINEQLSEAVADADPAALDPLLAAGNFGHALHTAEDLYAHSNWVELGQTTLFDDGNGFWQSVTPYEVRDGVMVVQGPSPFGPGSVTRDGLIVHINTGTQVFDGVITGQFGLTPADCPPEAVVSHDELNKDSAARPGFQAAIDLAIRQVRHEFVRLVQLVEAQHGTAQPLLDAWVKDDPTSQQQLAALLAEQGSSLGSVDADGVLTLNMGPRAGARGTLINNTDGAEAFIVTHVAGGPSAPGGEVVDVTFAGVTQRFSATAIVADGGEGDDSITLNGVDAPVEFTGGNGTDTLTIAAASANAAAYSLDDGSIAAGGTADFATIEQLNVLAGDGADTFEIRATSPGVSVHVDAAGGNDQFVVDSNGSSTAGGSVDLIRSALTLAGGAGTNSLTLEDSGDLTADVVTVTPAAIGAAAGDSFFGAGGSLNYSDLKSVTLNMPNAPTGDLIRLTPSATTAFFINGGSPSGPSSSQGDQMNIDTEDTRKRKRKVIGKDAGFWKFANRQPVTFTDVEKVQ